MSKTEEVKPCLAAWEQFLHESSLPPLATVALAHYQVEAIHPFLDGNGRVGRLLITLFLTEPQILPSPLLYLSVFFEASRRDYCDGFRGISERGAWADWLECFLNGVARMSEDALGRAERINEILVKWQQTVAREGTDASLRLPDMLAANPFITVKGAAEMLDVAFTIAQRAVQRLEPAECNSARQQIGNLRHGTGAKVSSIQWSPQYIRRKLMRRTVKPRSTIPTANFCGDFSLS